MGQAVSEIRPRFGDLLYVLDTSCDRCVDKGPPVAVRYGWVVACEVEPPTSNPVYQLKQDEFFVAYWFPNLKQISRLTEVVIRFPAGDRFVGFFKRRLVHAWIVVKEL